MQQLTSKKKNEHLAKWHIKGMFKAEDNTACIGSQKIVLCFQISLQKIKPF